MAYHQIEALFQYHFANLALLQEALDAGGPTRVDGPWDHHPNQRLADVGEIKMALVMLGDRARPGKTMGEK